MVNFITPRQVFDDAILDDFVASILEEVEKHYGPGNHPNGSPQSSHGEKGSHVASIPVAKVPSTDEARKILEKVGANASSLWSDNTVQFLGMVKGMQAQVFYGRSSVVLPKPGDSYLGVGHGYDPDSEPLVADGPLGPEYTPTLSAWTYEGPPITNLKRTYPAPTHFYRAVSEEEWQQAIERGYLSSDGRGNISDAEGTNADWTPETSYLPKDRPGRLIRMKYDPSDGWFTITYDQYVRTRGQVPIERVDLVSPLLRKTEDGWQFEGEVGKHYGPGPHANGTEQDVHGKPGPGQGQLRFDAKEKPLGGSWSSDEQHRKASEFVLDKDNLKRFSTHETHAPGGLWALDRVEKHQEIVDEIMEGAKNVPREGDAVLMGGLGGAGKTTLLTTNAEFAKNMGITFGEDGDITSHLVLNADDIKAIMHEKGLIPDVEGLSPGEESVFVHEEASHISKMLSARAYDERINVIWDYTMSSEGSVISRARDLAEHGYDNLRVGFVDVSADHSIKSALQRWKSGAQRFEAGEDDFGGRLVPSAIIRSSSTGSVTRSHNRDTFEWVRQQPWVSAWELWDNEGYRQQFEGRGTNDQAALEAVLAA